jgi:hypothetical protein
MGNPRMDRNTIAWLARALISTEDAPRKEEALAAAELLEARAMECRRSASIEGPRPNGNDAEADAYLAVARLYRHPESWAPEGTKRR